MTNRTLNLTLKKKWFDLILSGEKKEEYREVKNYFIKRFFKHEYKQILFRNGYSSNSRKILIKCDGIYIGNAKPEWSDNWIGEVFVIKLGKIIATYNIN